MGTMPSDMGFVVFRMKQPAFCETDSDLHISCVVVCQDCDGEGSPPVNYIEADESSVGQLRKVSEPNQHHMGERICLVVDDEPAIRTYLGAVLQRRGLQIFEAGNAVEALRILRDRGSQIDLLITDIQMPGDMDGIDLAYSVKTSFSTLPVIVISGYSDKAAKGFTLVRKPFSPDAILQAVDEVMPRGSDRRCW
jgi:CheY-like chemotaxis protein